MFFTSPSTVRPCVYVRRRLKLCYIRCAECKHDVDLCVGCFFSGQEPGEHKKTHSYRVMDKLNKPIFSGASSYGCGVLECFVCVTLLGNCTAHTDSWCASMAGTMFRLRTGACIVIGHTLGGEALEKWRQVRDARFEIVVVVDYCCRCSAAAAAVFVFALPCCLCGRLFSPSRSRVGLTGISHDATLSCFRVAPCCGSRRLDRSGRACFGGPHEEGRHGFMGGTVRYGERESQIDWHVPRVGVPGTLYVREGSCWD